MTMDRDFLMFVCGFYATREGFNGECQYEYLVPSVLGEDWDGIEACLEEAAQNEKLTAGLRRLCEQARAVIFAHEAQTSA